MTQMYADCAEVKFMECVEDEHREKRPIFPFICAHLRNLRTKLAQKRMPLLTRFLAPMSKIDRCQQMHNPAKGEGIMGEIAASTWVARDDGRTYT